MYNARAGGLALTEEPRPPAPVPPHGASDHLSVALLPPLSSTGGGGGGISAARSLPDWLPSFGSPSAALLEGLRAVPNFTSREWRFRNTVAFWIACCYAEGSLLFVVGAISAMAKVDGWREAALVEYSYFAGSLLYTAGAYLGHYEVINVARPAGSRRRLLALSGSSAAGYWGSLAYLVGAVLFNVDCGAAALSPRATKVVAVGVEWSPSTVGSALFVAGATIEWVHNRDARPKDAVWWLCLLYFVGSLSFLFASIAGLALSGGGDGGGGGTWACDFPFAVGSAAFFCGAWVALRMWKREQFGLGFIREINSLPPQTPAAPPSPSPGAAAAAARRCGAGGASSRSTCCSARSRRSTSARSPPPPSTTPSAPAASPSPPRSQRRPASSLAPT